MSRQPTKQDPLEASRDVRIIARKVGDIAAEAALDGLDTVTALMAGLIYVCRRVHMSDRDIANWFRRLADEFDREHREYQAQLRTSLRQPTKGD